MAWYQPLRVTNDVRLDRVPPLSSTSPDLTALTAASTESHTFFFGGCESTGTEYARTKWTTRRLLRGLGRESNVVKSMFRDEVA
jgi:hypothetical protein